ncbi:MAG: DNA mismatch repair endonuclease MutL [Lentisphaeria bacterium]|nr:DNA mismatch repair endonuclease MutL [Lentisphaeria bacterium]
MSNITILPEELSNRIAAGEVVERPASVVKELFENAVDAGAEVINVEIERAGSRLIRISDNGSGMDEADARLCFSPHATSKIKSAEDIERITTLGFRGEALPSIASVSKLTLKTRTAEKSEGIALELEGGKIVDQRPCGMPVGTVFAVRDLFYNVPARKKFLRSPATEEAHIQEMVIALALGFPHVAVTLKFDNKTALQASATSDPVSRAAGLFGKTFASRMLKVDHWCENIHVTGLIAMPGFTRTSRREQRTFVNGRAVESMALYRGIRDGYGTLADFGRFPPTVINIELDAAEYDINVHPTKREVRFKREYIVSCAVNEAVRSALSAAPAPEITLPGDKRLARPDILIDASKVSYTPAAEAPAIPGLGEKTHKDIFKQTTLPAAETAFNKQTVTDYPAISCKDASSFEPTPEAEPEQSIKPGQTANTAEAVTPNVTVRQYPVSPAEKTEETFSDTPLSDPTVIPQMPVRPPLALELAAIETMRYAGILFGTFIMLEDVGSENLYLIDFHAAHERVLYEELLARSQSGESVPSQQLLLPPAIELSRTEAAFITKNEKLFNQLGFDAAALSSNTILLNAVPANLAKCEDWEQVLSDIVAMALEGEKTTRNSLETIARAACHSAVKANDPLNEITAQALLKSLAKCQRPDVCPHGRPTVLKMTKTELSRRFGRI